MIGLEQNFKGLLKTIGFWNISGWGGGGGGEGGDKLINWLKFA